MVLFHWQPVPHQQIIDFGKISYKPQKSPYLPKEKRREKDAKAHGSSSWHIISFSAHESHQGNFGSHGLEGQEVCSVKL